MRPLRRCFVITLAAAALLAVDTGQLVAQDSSERAVPGRAASDSAGSAPLVVRGDTVLFVPTGYGAFSAAERAEAIGARLRSTSILGVDSLTLVHNESSTDVLADSTILMSITDRDAAAVGIAREALALEFRDALRS